MSGTLYKWQDTVATATSHVVLLPPKKVPAMQRTTPSAAVQCSTLSLAMYLPKTGRCRVLCNLTVQQTAHKLTVWQGFSVQQVCLYSLL